MADLKKSFGNRFKEIREEKDFTIAELAKASGYTKGQISAIENGTKETEQGCVLKLVQSMNVQVVYFYDCESLNDKEDLLKRLALRSLKKKAL